jgi:hypothetical protein
MEITQMAKVIVILNEIQDWLSEPGNHFAWSSWDNAEAALAEIDDVIAQINQDEFAALQRLKILFAPTGPIQDVSLSSGWGEDFLRLADHFDEILPGHKE